MGRTCVLLALIAIAATGCRRGDGPGLYHEWRSHRTGRLEARLLGIDHHPFRELRLFGRAGYELPPAIEVEITNGTEAAIEVYEREVDTEWYVDGRWRRVPGRVGWGSETAEIAPHERVIARYWVDEPPAAAEGVRVAVEYRRARHGWPLEELVAWAPILRK